MIRNDQNTNHFFNHFRNELENFSPEMSDSELTQVWDNISKNIPMGSPPQVNPFSKIFTAKIAGFTGLGIALITSAIIILNNNQKNPLIINQNVVSDTQKVELFKDENIQPPEHNSEGNQIQNMGSLNAETKNKSDIVYNSYEITNNKYTDLNNNNIQNISSEPVLPEKITENIPNSFPKVKFSDTILCVGDNLHITFNPSVCPDNFEVTLILPDEHINNFKGIKSYKFLQSGTYYITMIYSFDNQIIKNLQRIYVQPSPFAGFGFDNTNTPEIKFINLSTGADKYIWNFGDGTSSRLTHPVHNYQKSNTYQIRLIAENKFGCRSDYVQELEVIINSGNKDPYIPNFFSPDGDGKDDFYYITVENATHFDLKIMDRFGNIVFTAKDKDKKWDGTNELNGKPCLEGQYFYVFHYKTLQGTDIEKKSGTIYLKRK